MPNFKNVDWRKVFVIIAFLVTVLVLAFFIYYFFFKPITPPGAPEETLPTAQLPTGEKGVPPGVTTTTTTGEIKPGEQVYKIPAESKPIDKIARGSITEVKDLDYEATSAITLDKSGNQLISYNPNLGKFYKITPDGQKVELSKKIYKDVQSVSWGNGKEEAILEFPDGSNILYNFNNDTQVTLPKDWTEFSFAPADNQIAFKDMNSVKDFQFVGVANPDGSGIKYLENIGSIDKDFSVDWSPNGQMVGRMIKGQDAESNKFYFIGLNGENFKNLRVIGYGVEARWTPDGNRLIYSSHSPQTDHQPLLHIVDVSGDKTGQNHYEINLRTWPDKCTFQDSNTMYCGVPKELPYGVDYVPELADTIPDNIYKVDLTTGTKTFIAEPAFDYTVEKMNVSADGSTLYFTDKATQSLHSIRLK